MVATDENNLPSWRGNGFRRSIGGPVESNLYEDNEAGSPIPIAEEITDITYQPWTPDASNDCGGLVDDHYIDEILDPIDDVPAIIINAMDTMEMASRVINNPGLQFRYSLDAADYLSLASESLDQIVANNEIENEPGMREGIEYARGKLLDILGKLYSSSIHKLDESLKGAKGEPAASFEQNAYFGSARDYIKFGRNIVSCMNQLLVPRERMYEMITGLGKSLADVRMRENKQAIEAYLALHPERVIYRDNIDAMCYSLCRAANEGNLSLMIVPQKVLSNIAPGLVLPNVILNEKENTATYDSNSNAA